MKRVLITGFEPFGGECINPSWEAVKRVSEVIGEYELTKLCLPVVFGKAGDLAIEKAEEIGADVVLFIGQAGGRGAITPEYVGINLRHAKIPDNEGNQPLDEPIIEGGSVAYFSTLPVRKIAEAIASPTVPATVSYSAGAYVCNEVLYRALAHYSMTKTRVGFIHSPYCEEQKKEPCMSLSDIVRAIEVAIEHLDDA